MNLLDWSKKNCIAVPEETWHEHRAEVIAYIRANPNKIYLLPDDVQELFDGENFIRFAKEINFPCAAKLISSSREFAVESLSAVLDAIPYDENFLPTGKSFLVVSQDFISVADAVRRQCSILQVSLEICSEEDFATLSAEQKLLDNATNLLAELSGVKSLCKRCSELKLPENISCIEEFLSASKELENFLQKSNSAIKLLLAGESNERELLLRIFELLNFDAEIISETDLAEKLSNADVCVLAINALNVDLAWTENFLQTVTHSPDKDKIFFVVIRPALREQEPQKNFSRILFDFAEFLDGKGFKASPIFFLDAPEIFYCKEVTTLLATSDELLTVDKLLEIRGLKGRENFLTKISLEKFFKELPNPSSQSLLKKSGVPYLGNYLRQSLKKNSSAMGKLLCRIEHAILFLEDDTLKNIRLRQVKNLSAAARQAEIFLEKIGSIAMQEKIVSGNAIIKALFYDVNNAINNFVSAVNAFLRELWDELTISEEFSAEKLVALYRGKISAELKNLLDDMDAKLQVEYDKQLQKLLARIKKIISEHRTQAQSFIDVICLTAGHFSETPKQNTTLPELKFFDTLPFDASLSEIFSAEKISGLVKRCTRILCLRESEAALVDNREQLLKNFYLAGTFRRELRQRLDATTQDKLSTLEKNLRQKTFAATIEYFAQVSKICRTQRELCLKAFRRHAEDIYNRLDAINQDCVVMEEIGSSLKNFCDIWRLTYPKQSHKVLVEENFLDDLLAETLERKSRLLNVSLNTTEDLSIEKFLPDKDPHNHSGANAELFSLGKTAFLNRKYDNAFKTFSCAAMTGHVEAIKYLAYMHQNGLGTPKNIYAAIENYLDAFSLGDNISADELSEIFQNLKCYSRALEWSQTYIDLTSVP